jgi:hypothetical protein
MADLHIDDFYRDVAKIWLRLYKQFPRKTVLYVDDICGEHEPDEFGIPSDRVMGCFSTMLWLADEGYLRYDTPIRQEALDQAVLTERGFLLLSTRTTSGTDQHSELPPSVAKAHQSHIKLLRDALKSGSSIEIQCCVEQLLHYRR